MLNCLLPSCSCIAFETSSAFAHSDSVWGEATLFNPPLSMSGNSGFVSLVLRDTPHARVSVSYVLEASLLNDRIQRSPVGNTCWKRLACFLVRKYNTGVKTQISLFSDSGHRSEFKLLVLKQPKG